MAKLLPIGTVVQVTPFPVRLRTTPYKAIVAGYDLSHTKYRLRDELWPGEFMKEALSWAFPREVEEVASADEETHHG